MLSVLGLPYLVSCTCSLYPGFPCAHAQMQWLPQLRASSCLFPLQCQEYRLILLGLATDRGTLRKHRCADRSSHMELFWYMLLLWLLLMPPATPLTPTFCVTVSWQHLSALLTLLHGFLTCSDFCLLCVLLAAHWYTPPTGLSTRPPYSSLLHLFQHLLLQMLICMNVTILWEDRKIIYICLYFIHYCKAITYIHLTPFFKVTFCPFIS